MCAVQLVDDRVISLPHPVSAAGGLPRDQLQGPHEGKDSSTQRHGSPDGSTEAVVARLPCDGRVLGYRAPLLLSAVSANKRAGASPHMH